MPRKDNLRLFTPEILDRINVEVVREGHQLLKKKIEENLAARCDSFVVETDGNEPTDINLLYDAIRKMIEESAKLSQTNGLNGWRQSAYHIRQFKKKYRLVQKLKHSTSSAQKQKKKKADEIRQQHEIYLNDAYDYMNRAKQTRTLLKEAFLNPPIDNLNHYIRHASL